ncbi:MAG TPA: endonuclease/exonuclease/phosphatase family protein [Acidimicrobiales bacterium]|jgi:endonuclease/exonuclease/phosphatase family metal-dependent hydrolase
MRVVTFNIQHGKGGDAAALGRACAGLGADVLALQEVDVRVPRSGFVDQVSVVVRATGMQAVFGRTCRVGVVGRYGNALCSRLPMSDVECVRLPRLGRNEVRGVIVARVEGVTIAATHLSVHPEENVGQLDFVLDVLRSRPRPWVLVGDLNRRPEQLDAVVAAGLALVDTAAPTFPAHAPDRRIDHIAVTGVEVRTVDVLPQQEVGDHRPLAATLSSQ